MGIPLLIVLLSMASLLVLGGWLWSRRAGAEGIALTYDPGEMGIQVVIDDDGHLVSASPRLAGLLGGAKSYRGLPLQQFCHTEADAQQVDVFVARLEHNRLPGELLFDLAVLPDRHLQWHFSPLKGTSESRARFVATANDITALLQGMDQLRNHEARLRQVFRLAPVGMVLAEGSGQLIEANEEYAQFLGYAAASALEGQSLLDHVVAEHQPVFQAAILAALGGRNFRLELRFQCRNGMPRWGDASGNVLQDDADRPYLVVQVADIAERKGAELALTENRNQLVAAQRVARLGSWRWDIQRQELEISEVLREMVGASPQRRTVDGNALRALVLPDDLAQFDEHLRRLRQGVSSLQVVVRARTFQGEWRYWRVDVALSQPGAGDAAFLMGTAQDITEERLAEVASRESEARYRSLFDTNMDGLYFLSLSGQIEEANPAFLTLTGYTASEVQGLPVHTLTPEEWRAADDMAGNQIRIQGYCDLIEKALLRRDGSRVPVMFRAWQLRDSQGEVVRVIGMVRDITALKKMESERAALERGMRQAQKMEAIGQLTGGIAHDFNNILASILGYTELALRRQSVSNDSDLSRQLGEVQQAGERGRELIRQMLLFSRGGRRSGKAQSVGPLIADVARMLQPTLPSTIELSCSAADDTPEILMDEVALQQVVMNLVLNARDALEGTGKISVDLSLQPLERHVCSSCHHEFAGPMVVLTVADDGLGMSPVTLERMFEPFFSTKPPGQGTGMGLAVVHGIVHEFQGHILVDSSGQGCRFSIVFPAAAQRDGDHEPFVAMGEGQRLLVVDDEIAVSNLLADLLRQQGYEPLLASDADSALEIIKSQSLDLLITDYLMPGMDGIQLGEQAQRILPGLPVILLSGRSAITGVSRGWPILQKPLNIPGLLACVAGELAGSDASHRFDPETMNLTAGQQSLPVSANR